MKPYVFLALALIACKSFSQSFYSGDSWKSIKQNGAGQLTIIFYECPKLIEQSNGMPKGVCVDVLKDFAEFVKTTYQKNVQVNYLSRESASDCS